ncbi:Permease of the drug/metabolite transporter (DMT) superfamily [Clostridium cavendishii DSM 21758]|uniref:Permease of the drug/metabolite transporter (DMT) superfamily n=1 Tax=Clostridium cavendishii DSM 21758 TaxID=1121302 RepID=A0A1M6BCC2_9CLOT|nr:DMT family transporter [Clostridium cavendishii]SHI46391.1 Permease of the drug/metabolite transporter (DMT) superfamily [Clostridium cavendishii DSM 21758]
MKLEKKLGYLAAFFNAVIIGLAFLFTKKAVTLTNPYNTLAMRFTVSFLVILIAILTRVVKVNFKGKNIKALIYISIFFPSGFFLLQSFGLKYASSSEAGIINALIPAIILVLSIIFLKEEINLKQVGCVILSILGVFYIFFMKGNTININSLLGIILIFGSCVFFSIYSILSRKYSKEFTPMEICLFMQGFGFVVFTSLSIVNGFTLTEFKGLVTDSSFMVSILYLAIPSTLITAILNNYSLAKVEASKVGVFSNISTIVSIAAGALILNEEVKYYHIIGSVIIILGIVGTNYFSKKIRKKI